MTSVLIAGGTSCPCGSRRAYQNCCGRLHAGAPAGTAEELMRARYTANVLGEDNFLFRSWHPRTRPDHIETAGIRWSRLTVLRTVDGQESDDTGTVEFSAEYTTPAGPGVLHETSRFERRRGSWVYVDGTTV
jgi:SEC-C motif-containing protein